MCSCPWKVSFHYGYIFLHVFALSRFIFAILSKSHFTSGSRVGRNVAAGMTGGLAYLLDEDDTLIPKVSA